MPDIDLHTEHGPARLSELFHDGRWVLLELDDAAAMETTPNARRVRAKTAEALGATALLLRPDGYVHAAAGL